MVKLILPQKIDQFITMDTGVNIGLAFWENHLEPVDTKCIKGPSQLPYDDRLRFVLFQFKSLLQLQQPRKIYIEKPSFRDTGKGIISARSGSLFKLIKSYILEQYILEEFGFKVIEVLPEEWKGQLDKSKVDMRIEKILNKSYPEHVSDAVGMGLWVKGLFGPQKKIKE